MSDRQLLEDAAKAAGLQEWGWNLRPSTPVVGLDRHAHELMTDDGDALRLAVKLNLHVGIDCESAGSVTVEWGFDQGGEAAGTNEEQATAGGDDAAATRRAIVRAAAEIGRAM